MDWIRPQFGSGLPLIMIQMLIKCREFTNWIQITANKVQNEYKMSAKWIVDFVSELSV